MSRVGMPLTVTAVIDLKLATLYPTGGATISPAEITLSKSGMDKAYFSLPPLDRTERPAKAAAAPATPVSRLRVPSPHDKRPTLGVKIESDDTLSTTLDTEPYSSLEPEAPWEVGRSGEWRHAKVTSTDAVNSTLDNSSEHLACGSGVHNQAQLSRLQSLIHIPGILDKHISSRTVLC